MSDHPGHEFMVATHYAQLRASEQRRGVPQPPLEWPYDAAQPRICLPSPYDVPLQPCDLRTLIEERSSIREYAPTPLALDELAYLLWCTQGVRQRVGDKLTLRTVPSAGARHAFETYLVINQVEGIASGLYRYLAMEHALYGLPVSGDITADVTAACLGQEMIGKCAVTFIWVAVAARMTWRYGERGYRYLHLDAGHVCQNLYLAAQPLDCGVCAIAAFDDDLLNNTLQLNGKELFAIYLATVGKKRMTKG